MLINKENIAVFKQKFCFKKNSKHLNKKFYV